MLLLVVTLARETPARVMGEDDRALIGIELALQPVILLSAGTNQTIFLSVIQTYELPAADLRGVVVPVALPVVHIASVFGAGLVVARNRIRNRLQPAKRGIVVVDKLGVRA